jgi:hypothetical protein
MNKMKMKHIYLIVISMAFLVGCGDEQPIKHKIWQMKNDIALIEVESVIEGTDSTGFWEDFKLVPGFTGKKAYRFANSGNDYMDPLAHDAPKTDIPFRLIYRINVEEPGEYEIRIRNYHLEKDGDNDAWIGINNELFEKIWDHDTAQWSWNEAIAWQYSYQPRFLEKGVNKIVITGRSKGFAIDRLAIVKKGTADSLWQPVGLPESDLFIVKNKPESVSKLKLLYRGLNHAQIAWEPAKNALFYNVFLNGVKVAETYSNACVVRDLTPQGKNVLTVESENSTGIKSVESEPFDITDFNYEDALKAISVSSLEELSITKRLYPGFNLLVDSTSLYIQVTTKEQFGWIHIYIDPDNSKSETYSINDRLYLASLETGDVKERLNRDKNVRGVLIEKKESEQEITLTLMVPFKTLGRNLSLGESFGLKIFIIGKDKNMDQMQVVCSSPFNSLSLLPNSFADVIIN